MPHGHIRDSEQWLAVNHFPFSPAAEGLEGRFSMVMTTKTKIGSNLKGFIFLRAAKCTRVMRLVKRSTLAAPELLCPQMGQVSGWAKVVLPRLSLPSGRTCALGFLPPKSLWLQRQGICTLSPSCLWGSLGWERTSGPRFPETRLYRGQSCSGFLPVDTSWILEELGCCAWSTDSPTYKGMPAFNWGRPCANIRGLQSSPIS